MAIGKIRIRVDLRDIALLPAQRASIKFVAGLDRPDRRHAAPDISRQRGFRRRHGARWMEHLAVLRIAVHSYGGHIRMNNIAVSILIRWFLRIRAIESCWKNLMGKLKILQALSRLGLIAWIGKQTESIILSVNEESRLAVAILLLLWVSALASAFVDNVPLATMMVRIATNLAQNRELDLPMQPLVWALTFGACMGGKKFPKVQSLSS